MISGGGEEMYSVKEMCSMAGVSARTLQYYDRIGLLKAACRTEAGYRLYDDESIARLEQILILKELDFSLDDIRLMLDSDAYDRNMAMEEQIRLLTLKKERLELIVGALKRVQEKGDIMDFNVFSDAKLKEYEKAAKEKWGDTKEYAQSQKKQAERTGEEEKEIADRFMGIFKEFGEVKDKEPEDEAVQSLVKKLQKFISSNYYECSNEILSSLGMMYAAGGEFTANIDRAGGKGTAEFTAKAIKEYVK